jgi:hypothetical protein
VTGPPPPAQTERAALHPALLQADPVRIWAVALPTGFVGSDVGLMIEPLLAHSPVDTRTARVAEEDIGDEVPRAGPRAMGTAYMVSALRLRPAPPDDLHDP